MDSVFRASDACALLRPGSLKSNNHPDHQQRIEAHIRRVAPRRGEEAQRDEDIIEGAVVRFWKRQETWYWRAAHWPHGVLVSRGPFSDRTLAITDARQVLRSQPALCG